MPDAAVSVTQSAVERFTAQYLRSLGCSIEMSENRWKVTVPDGVDTAVSTGEVTMILGDDSDDEETDEVLHPESGFFQQILSEASERCPTGTLSIEAGDTEVRLPSWLRESTVEVADAQFTPYYDRTAIVFLFRVSIETVNEYQRELLHAIAIDTRSREQLPELEAVFLRSTSLEGNTPTSNRWVQGVSDVRPILDTARDQLIERIQPVVDEVHKAASRAADAEVEEYRQMQQQRIEELERERSNVSSKVEELNEIISSGEQEERVRVLKERKDFTSDLDEIDAELADLRDRRDRGFPERQRKIRERHALDVQTTPLTMTQVEYERGEIDLELIEDGIVESLTLGYGTGVGITEEVACSSCGQNFSERISLQSIRDGLRCEECALSADST